MSSAANPRNSRRRRPCSPHRPLGRHPHRFRSTCSSWHRSDSSPAKCSAAQFTRAWGSSHNLLPKTVVHTPRQRKGSRTGRAQPPSSPPTLRRTARPTPVPVTPNGHHADRADIASASVSNTVHLSLNAENSESRAHRGSRHRSIATTAWPCRACPQSAPTWKLSANLASTGWRPLRVTADASVPGTDDSSSLTIRRPCGSTPPRGAVGDPPRRAVHRREPANAARVEQRPRSGPESASTPRCTRPTPA